MHLYHHDGINRRRLKIITKAARDLYHANARERISTGPAATNAHLRRQPGHKTANQRSQRYGGAAIEPYLDRICKTIKRQRFTIVEAATGVGKSTVLPLELLSRGFEKVYVTQPRRAAAEKVAERLAYLLGHIKKTDEKVGGTVGVCHGFGQKISPETKIVVCTHGYLAKQLVALRKAHDPLKRSVFERLCDGVSPSRAVFLFDEVHELDTQVEVLFALAREAIDGAAAREKSPYLNPDRTQQIDLPRFVAMSATMDTWEISRHFGGVLHAPVLRVPGSAFPVEERQLASSTEQTILQLIQQGHRSIVVFEPGKAQIERDIAQTSEFLHAAGVRATLLPFHAELEVAQREAALTPRDGITVVFGTTALQTSLTFPSVTALVDNGTKNRPYTELGFAHLETVYTSQATRTQRRGRVGRIDPNTRPPELPGRDVYIDLSGISPAQRQRFPTPQIGLKPCEDILLAFKSQDQEVPWGNFIHVPPAEERFRAARTLEALGIIGTSGKITELGRRVSVISNIEPYLAKMVVLADAKESILDPLRVPTNSRLVKEMPRTGLRGYACAVAALFGSKGITAKESWQWQGLDQVALETESDLFRELLAYEHSKRVLRADIDEAVKRNVLASLGIDHEALRRTILTENNIRRRLGESVGRCELDQMPLIVANDKNFAVYRRDLQRIVIESMLHALYLRQPRNREAFYTNLQGDNYREPPSDSVARAPLIVGVPFSMHRNPALDRRETDSDGFDRIVMGTSVPPDFMFTKGDIARIALVNPIMAERLSRGIPRSDGGKRRAPKGPKIVRRQRH